MRIGGIVKADAQEWLCPQNSRAAGSARTCLGVVSFIVRCFFCAEVRPRICARVSVVKAHCQVGVLPEPESRRLGGLGRVPRIFFRDELVRRFRTAASPAKFVPIVSPSATARAVECKGRSQDACAEYGAYERAV